MAISFFLAFRNQANPETRVDAADKDRFIDIVGRTPGLQRALIYEPDSATDPYLNDGPPPQFAAQLYFSRIEDLESALAGNGHLQALAASDAFASLSGSAVTQQAMLSRSYPVPEAALGTAAPQCSYLVAYEGRADDLNAWLYYYITHHPPMMARFAGIREIEVCTRIDWCGSLPWPRVDYMLRNKVVFDSAAALTAALASPVRSEMRADYETFPPFCGPVSHYPMTTLAVII